MTDRVVTVPYEGITLARLIWREFRKQPAGYIEKVLEKNRGIANYTFLPLGMTVIMPLPDLSNTDRASDIVRLWD